MSDVREPTVSGDVVFLRPGRWMVAGLFAFCVPAFLFLLAEQLAGPSNPPVAVVIEVLEVVLIVACVGLTIDALLCSVELTDDGVERRRFLFHRTLPWERIEGASMEVGRRWHKPVLLVSMADGQVQRLVEVRPATIRSSPDDVHPDNERLVRMINERVAGADAA